MTSPPDILHGKILIVDDQKANAFLLEQLLRRAGYVSIASTKNPGEVAKLHLINHYDLILLDLEMPGMDGFQVMESLKEVESEGYLPVLVLTAHPDHKLRALQFGAKDFISKPYELAEVLLRVHNMLEVRLLHKAARHHGENADTLMKTADSALSNTKRAGKNTDKMPEPFNSPTGLLNPENHTEYCAPSPVASQQTGS